MSLSTHPTPGRTVWFSADDCRLEDLLDVLADGTDPGRYPLASSVEQGVLIYDYVALAAHTTSIDGRRAVQSELARGLQDGPGVVVLQGAFPDTSVVDRATDTFNAMIAEQREAGTSAGDHFAKPGANDRVWNALEKLALREPQVFADYYANDAIALVATAWLGPGYQVTSQVNVVNPGGAGQTVHRDYHLGFQSNEVAEQFPAQTHHLSPLLTLQGAVAHCDMPVETGPTLYLPHSHKYELGYLAWRRPEFHEYFEAHHVQLPLAKGDAVFFNPALFHAAGSNHSQDIKRMANLLQISSAFGRAMEIVDRQKMSEALFPVLVELTAAGIPAQAVENVIAASAEGYSFPTNLDRDQPIGGMAPLTQADLVHQAVQERLPLDDLRELLRRQSTRRSSRPLTDGA